MPDPTVRVVVKADDQASGPLNKVAANIRSFRESSEQAGRGLGKIGNILGDISREALGATGPLGRVAEKLIELGIGGGAFVLIAAGIAGLVTLFEKMTAATREAREETDKLIASLYKTSPAGQHEERVKQLKQLNDRITEIQTKLDPSRNPFAFALQSAEEVKQLREELSKLIYERQRLLNQGAVDLPELTTGESPEQRFKREQREKRAQAGADQAALDIRNAGGPQVVGRPGIPTRATSADQRVDPGELPFGQAADAALSFHDAMALITEITPNVAAGLDAINDSLLGQIPGFNLVARAAQKAVQIVAKVEGTIAIAKGAVKLAESIWPFNPAGIASGTKMIAEGTKLAALGGGGGSGGASGGGYGGGPGGGFGFADRATQTQQQQRDSVEVILPPIIPTTDPGVQDWLADVVRNAQGRNVVFRVGV